MWEGLSGGASLRKEWHRETLETGIIQRRYFKPGKGVRYMLA